MKKNLKILILEDSVSDADLIQDYLRRAGMKFDAKVVSTQKEFTEALENFGPEVILSDHSMPQFNSIEALKIFKAHKLNIPFILVTGSVSEEFAVQTIQEGANDYILKDRLGRLPAAILNALEKYRIEAERQKYINELVAKEALVSKVEKLAHIGSWQNDLVNNVVTWSDENYRILGYEPGEIMPSRDAFLKSTHPLDRVRLKRAIEDAEVKNEHSLKINYRILCKDKSIKYLSSEMFFERDENNKALLSTGFTQDITEFKLAEEKLNKSNQELARVLENVDECLYSLDTSTYKFLQVSVAVEKVYGYTRKDFFANSRIWYNIILPEDKHIVDSADEKIFKGESVAIQYRITHKNGSIRWLESKVIPIPDEAGKIIRIDGVVRDITEKKESEERLRRSQVHLLSSQTIGHVGSWEILDISVNDPLHGSPLYWSDEAFRIFGFEPGEIKMNTKIFLQMVHPADRDKVNIEFREAFENRKDYVIDHRIIRKDGVERFVHERGEIIYDTQTGKRIKMTGTVQDITERKKAEEQIRESEQHLAEAQHVAKIGSWNYDIVTDRITWSRELYNIFGITKQNFNETYFSFINMINEEDREAATQISKHCRETGEPFTVEYRITTPGGEKRIIKENGFAQKNDDGKVVRLFGTAQDITERKMAELEREKITADLIQRNKDLEQFTYIVSHNLRAPVANIMGFSEAIRNAQLSDKERQEVEAGLADSVHRLDEVIHDLNNILKIRNQVNEAKASVDLSVIVKDIKASNHNLIVAGNAIIKTNFTAMGELFTIKSYIYSIFYNLISNSIKYRRPGVNPVIEIKSAIVNNKIVLTFKDNGMGIDLDKRGNQVFGLYKRFHSWIEGKGIGLFMVKTQVETLGGKIKIKSEVNKGTEFTIEFPL